MRGWGVDNREWDLLKKLQQVQFSQDRGWEGGGTAGAGGMEEGGEGVWKSGFLDHGNLYLSSGLIKIIVYEF